MANKPDVQTFLPLKLKPTCLAFLLVLSNQANAGGELPHFSIACENESKTVDVQFTDFFQKETYRARPNAREIVFFEESFYAKPTVISKLEYADACLTALNGREYTELPREIRVCNGIKFLSENGAFEEQDLFELEDFSFSRGSERTNFEPSDLKVAFDCIYER